MARERSRAVSANSTKLMLIEAAETLYGRYGLDGISLREITTAAGQANSNVVHYHFGDKTGLIEAILDYRVQQIELMRESLLRELSGEAKTDVRLLLKTIWEPMLSFCDDDGQHAFCRFMLQYMLHPKRPMHPSTHFYLRPGSPDVTMSKRFASLLKITKLLFSLHPHLPRNTLARRMASLATMFLASVVEHDNRVAAGFATGAPDIEGIIDMAAAALAAPASRP